MPFAPVTDKDIEAFRRIAGDRNVLSGGAIPEEYTHDEMAPVRAWPEVVARAGSTAEVTQILEYCCGRQIPVTPRGSGTGLMGGAVPTCGGLLLDLTRMNRILEVDRENLLARVQPGVTLLELAETVEAQGLFYAPDPGEKSGSIGGNVNTNAGGMRAVKYGVTRDHIRGLELVLSSGEVLVMGGRVAKNSTGYNLMQLVIGSEGTLGVVTEITVRLLPRPPMLASLLVPFESLDDAIETVPRFAGAGITPQAIEFLRRGVIEASERYLGRSFPDQSAPAYLLLRFDGASPEELEAQMDAAGRVCLESGAIDAFIADTDERQDALWNARGAFLEAIKGDNEIDECDIVVPRAVIAEMVNYADEVADEVGLRIETFGHAGDGNMHINLIRDDLDEEQWKDRVERGMALLYRKADQLDGMVSGEHGIGHSKRAYLAEYTDPRQMELMRQIKGIFDPAGILNPEKIL